MSHKGFSCQMVQLNAINHHQSVGVSMNVNERRNHENDNERFVACHSRESETLYVT